MLADIGSSMMMHSTSLADDSTLCAKKDRIISLFDMLLKKLGGEVCLDSVIFNPLCCNFYVPSNVSHHFQELALNISNGKMGDEFKVHHTFPLNFL